MLEVIEKPALDTPNEPEENQEERQSVVRASSDFGSGPRDRRFLTLNQRRFAQEYVLNGGNQVAAATSAGYSSPESSARQCLLNAQVLGEIRRLSIVHAEAKLPMAIKRLVEIIESPSTPAQAAVNAIIGLMDRAGMKPKTGPMVAIQNNTYNQASANDVQAKLAELWATRDARMSDIAGGMPDKKPRPGTRAHYRAVAEKARAEQAGGGGVDEGSPATSTSIPGTPPAPDAETYIDPDDGDGEQG
jgi:hypothetical protein